MAKIELKHVESEVSYLPKARRWECRILTQGEPSFRLVLTRRKADARLMGEIYVAQSYRKMATKLADENNASVDRAAAMVSWRASWPFYSADAPLAEPPKCSCMSSMYRAPKAGTVVDLALEEKLKNANKWLAKLHYQQFKHDEWNRGILIDEKLKIVKDPNYDPIGKDVGLNALYHLHKRDNPSV